MCIWFGWTLHFPFPRFNILLHFSFLVHDHDCSIIFIHSLILTSSNIVRKPSVIVWIFALLFEMSRGSSQHRIHGLFERALANEILHNSVVLWRCYVAYEINIACNPSAARRIFFRAIHACPWSKSLWLDGFLKLNSILTGKELSDLQEVMRDKELNLRTDIYEILLQDDLIPWHSFQPFLILLLAGKKLKNCTDWRCAKSWCHGSLAWKTSI